MILRVENLVKHFFGVTAVDKVSFEIEKGQIVGLIGPNGSGKTTVFNCITKFLQPDGGQIIFQGKNITHYPAHKVSRSGITRNFQLARNFAKMTVLENMMMFAQEHQEIHLMPRLFWTAPVRENEKKTWHKAMNILSLWGLEALSREPAGNLSGGQQKILSVAQCLMADPVLLLLDEPTAAINPTLIKEIQRFLRELNASGQTIILIEHNMDVVMELCHRVIVLNYGQKIAEGSPREIRNNTEVIDAYFGG